MPVTAPVIEVYRGDTTPFGAFRFREPDVDEDTPGDPLDVSGWEWIAQWRLNPDDGAFIELELELDQAADGYVFVNASADQTASMTGSGVWDLQATEPDEDVKTWVRGKTKLVGDVSRV